MDSAYLRPTSSQPTLAQKSSATERSHVLTLDQAANYLRISKAHLSNVINGRVAGVPPLRHAHAGRRILIKRTWADDWLEQMGQESLQQW